MLRFVRTGTVPAWSPRFRPAAFRVSWDPRWIPLALDQALAGRVLPSIDKLGRLAIVAAQRAMASGNLAADGPDDVGLVLGTMFSGARTITAFDRRAQMAGPEYASPLDFANTVLNAAAGQAAIRLSLRGVNATIAGGYTSGLQAVAYAADLISGGRATTLLAGGVEELFAESFVGFCRTGVMCGTNGRPGHVPVPFDAERTGCALGEGAGFLVLERDHAAASRGAAVQGRIAGYASVTDPDAIDRGCCGREAIAAAVRSAMSRARCAGDRHRRDQCICQRQLRRGSRGSRGAGATCSAAGRRCPR